jgi:hypothetical protein
MRKSGASKREPAAEPSPLELNEFVNQVPLNINELRLAWESKDYDRIADLLRERFTAARLAWQIAHEVCATPVTVGPDPRAKLGRWNRLDFDQSERILGSKAARHLGWTRPAFLKAWSEFIGPYWEFDENRDYSESLLLQLKADKSEADRKRKAARERNRRARKKPAQEKSEKP